jgi:nucleoside-diphosphate-sugar epimerase
VLHGGTDRSSCHSATATIRPTLTARERLMCFSHFAVPRRAESIPCQLADEQMSDPHLVVVGASGWIGRHIVEKAAERGLAGCAVSRQSDAVGPWRTHPLSDLEKLTRRPGAVVVNAAGMMRGDWSTLHQANVELVELLGRTCRQVGAGLITLGSAAEYGVPVNWVAAESDPPRPTSQYGRSKWEGTQLILKQVEFGLCATVVRVFNLVGAGRPGIDPISDFARAVNSLPASGGTVQPYDSTLVRDLTGVDRAAEILLDLCGHVGEATVVNLCSGHGVRFRDLIEAMAEVRGVRIVVQDANPGGIPRVVGDPRVLFQLVGEREPQSVRELAEVALGGR